MYSPKLREDQIKQLYYLKEALKKEGIKTSMSEIVRTAVDKELDKMGSKINEGMLLIEKSEKRFSKV